MSYNRKFTHIVDGDSVEFDVTYNPENHFFTVVESGIATSYLLKFDMANRVWSTEDGSASKLSPEDLAILVQKHFGRSV